MVYSQSWFVCRVASVTDALAGLERGERASGEAERTYTATAGRMTAELRCSAGAELAVSDDGKLMLLRHGEIYAPAGVTTAAQLLRRYLVAGPGFVAELDGSFALLIVDALAGAISVVTDRLASRKVYAGLWGGEQWLSSRMDLLPTNELALDRTALACYLVNGVVHNGRTLFEGISALRRACVHRLAGGQLVAEPYWHYHFDNSAAERPAPQLQAELGDLLIESVRRRLPDGGATYLSLSAGYDATGILGVLGKSLKVPVVHCRSYSLGAHHDDDAVVAQAMAGVYGYDHQIVASYHGDLVGTITRNVARGHGHAHFCEEVQFWETVGPELRASSGAVFVGDECFGIKDATPPTSHAELLRKVQIRSYADMPWLAEYLTVAVVRDLDERWSAELAAIISGCPQSDSLEDYRDYLYLDQRTCNVILPWRERFAGAWSPVRIPLLDSAILDFVRGLPATLRRGKQLYKATVSNIYPELFTAQRGRSHYMPAWSAEYARHAGAILAQLDAQSSRLDAYLPPEVIAHLLADNQTAVGEAGGVAQLLRHVSHKALRRLQLTVGWKGRAGRSGAPAANRGALLNRLLVLRAALHARASDHTPAPISIVRRLS